MTRRTKLGFLTKQTDEGVSVNVANALSSAILAKVASPPLPATMRNIIIC